MADKTQVEKPAESEPNLPETASGTSVLIDLDTDENMSKIVTVSFSQDFREVLAKLYIRFDAFEFLDFSVVSDEATIRFWGLQWSPMSWSVVYDRTSGLYQYEVVGFPVLAYKYIKEGLTSVEALISNCGFLKKSIGPVEFENYTLPEASGVSIANLTLAKFLTKFREFSYSLQESGNPTVKKAFYIHYDMYGLTCATFDKIVGNSKIKKFKPEIDKQTGEMSDEFLQLFPNGFLCKFLENNRYSMYKQTTVPDELSLSSWMNAMITKQVEIETYWGGFLGGLYDFSDLSSYFPKGWPTKLNLVYQDYDSERMPNTWKLRFAALNFDFPRPETAAVVAPDSADSTA